MHFKVSVYYVQFFDTFEGGSADHSKALPLAEWLSQSVSLRYCALKLLFIKWYAMCCLVYCFTLETADLCPTPDL